MEILKNEYHFPSSTGVGEIYARSFASADKADVRAIFQIAHGMAEHGDRYDDFARYLAERGYAVYVIDHAGHGKSAAPEDWGYFGERDGWSGVIADSKLLTDIARSEHPGLPVVFFGHSMGSFVARLYAERYGNDLAGAIFCGTSGANPAAGVGILLAGLIAKLRGGHHRSSFLDSMGFGAYNKRIENARTKFDWLSVDEENVDSYVADPACGFLFTAAGFRDVLTLLSRANSKEWFQNLPRDLPVYLISGQDDPVGNYGKGVQEVVSSLRESGQRHVDSTLYPGARHEILLEKSINAQVYADILNNLQLTIDNVQLPMG
ncbi:MAG: alpha/beta hydrolase [Oscillospiraceae bacterium]|jgi:alpha-beta hydrolase superfamily lysophospholipase|nr:alpha/beta hydrolase [Oscillospiraceae bacterium]